MSDPSANLAESTKRMYRSVDRGMHFANILHMGWIFLALISRYQDLISGMTTAVVTP